MTTVHDYAVARAEAEATYPAHVIDTGGPDHYAAGCSQTLHLAVDNRDLDAVRRILTDPWAALDKHDHELACRTLTHTEPRVWRAGDPEPDQSVQCVADRDGDLWTRAVRRGGDRWLYTGDGGLLSLPWEPFLAEFGHVTAAQPPACAGCGTRLRGRVHGRWIGTDSTTVCRPALTPEGWVGTWAGHEPATVDAGPAGGDAR